MPRVYEVARSLGLSSKEVLAHLDEMGEPASSHASTIDEAVAERLREHVRNGAGIDEETSPLPAEESPTAAPETKEEPEEPPKKKHRSAASHVAELPVLVLAALVIAIIIKTFLVQAFYIPSGSMIPSLRVGDRVLVEKVSYVFGDPRRGEIIVFEKSVVTDPADVPWYDDARNFLRELIGLPTGLEEDYIKRVVAIGGDTIRYSGQPRQLFINGEEVDISYVKTGRDPSSPTLTEKDCEGLDMHPVDGGCRVPAGMVFLMGDNRSNSEDSRILGPVDEDKIIGRAFLIIWPPTDFGTL